MRAKIGLAVLLLLVTFWAVAQQQTTKRPATEALSSEPARVSQADLQHMHTLVQQMQMNLVSLPPGPTPLRHQFELEIEMWQTLISHLEPQAPATAPPGH